MKSSIHRKKKYGAKLDGEVARNRAIRYGPEQKSGFRVAVGGQVGIERLVKSVLMQYGIMPGFNHFYMNFAKKISRDKEMYSGATLTTEVCAERTHWSLRGLTEAVMDEIISRLGLSPCVPPPPTCDWLFKRKLTFTGNVSATNLDDFPVLVHLTNANFDFNKAQALGQDIRFMDSDTCPTDGTPLKHEIEQWDKPGANAWIWVKVPRIDGGSVADFIYMFYNNGVVADGQDPPNVWDAGFKAVLHMRAPAGVNVPDSTANSNDYTKKAAGEPNQTADGQIQGAQEFDGNNDFCQRAFDADFQLGNPATHLAVEFWIKSPSQPANGFVYIVRKVVQQDYYQIVVLGGGAETVHWYMRDSGGLAGTVIGATDVCDGTYNYVVAMFDTTLNEMRLYVNGVSDAVPVVRAFARVNPDSYSVIGAADNAGLEPINAKMDEFRVTVGTLRTPDWIMAQFKSMDETLITYGAETPS